MFSDTATLPSLAHQHVLLAYPDVDPDMVAGLSGEELARTYPDIAAFGVGGLHAAEVKRTLVQELQYPEGPLRVKILWRLFSDWENYEWLAGLRWQLPYCTQYLINWSEAPTYGDNPLLRSILANVLLAETVLAMPGESGGLATTYALRVRKAWADFKEGKELYHWIKIVCPQEAEALNGVPYSTVRVLYPEIASLGPAGIIYTDTVNTLVKAEEYDTSLIKPLFNEIQFHKPSRLWSWWAEDNPFLYEALNTNMPDSLRKKMNIDSLGKEYMLKVASQVLLAATVGLLADEKTASITEDTRSVLTSGLMDTAREQMRVWLTFKEQMRRLGVLNDGA